MREKKLAHGAELLRLVRGSNVEYDRLLERLLTQETSFNRYPAHLLRAGKTRSS